MKYIKDLNEAANTDFSKMLHIDLVDKYSKNWQEKEYREKFAEYKSKIKGFAESNGDLNIGDIIEFTSGMNNDIRYTTEILGFDGDGDIYLLWDCFWFPIRKEDTRSIKVIKKA